ncbi:MAG: VanZ family protein [Bacteroidota bacterium]|jgi:VanZ family protein|nr:VanZ family protein [Bacteroidota bacterium]
MTVSGPVFPKYRHGRLATSLPAFLWFLLIMVLLSLPGESFPVVAVWKPDKLAHIALFGMQALLLWVALVLPSAITPLRLTPLLVSGLATILFGIASEVYQALCTTRMADPYDVLANTIGVLLALLAVRLLGPHRLLTPLRSVFSDTRGHDG